MALVQRTHLVRLTFRDDDQTESTCEVNLASGVDLDSALTFLAGWRSIIAALSSAVCVASDLLVRLAETHTAGAGLDSDVTRQGTFIFTTAAAGLAVVRVPSIESSRLESTGPYAGIRIDQSQAAVGALIDALTNGLAGVEPCGPFVSDLVTIDQAYKELF